MMMFLDLNQKKEYQTEKVIEKGMCAGSMILVQVEFIEAGIEVQA
ncbi:hypothetical protein Ferp_1400 [Ferroglobus placidus DSM 10642]|uniref:Uncharacterized protein n=1 Tax=Ferroglobus placidus (strain DSM 10642 / AEDII12DO) TaxID=589924 RepID=D3RYI8_FERPA|nr:hypothetical protein Ferp_1400 [Ferroglobus placidus DSM 10642]